jgi:type VI secretion system protein ImpL
LLAAFTRNLPLTLTVLAVLVGLVVLGLVLLVRKKRVPAPVKGQGGAPPPGEVVVDFRDSGLQPRISAAFRRALHTIRRRLGRGGLYRDPWFLLLGEAAAKGRTLAGAGLPLPLGAPEHASAEEGEGCVFWFFEHGVVLDLAGDCVLRADGSSDAGAWRHFLSLLRETRPERPLDGVVLALSCADLIGAPQQEGQRVSRAAAKGDALCRRLREAQEQTGMVFPVYVLVTGCQQVPGFAAFVSEVPEPMRGDLMGWSNPYTLETSFRPEWVDEAFGALEAGLHRAQVDAFGDQPVVEDPDGVFCFSGEMQRLGGELRSCLGQVFRSSVYHELLPCRGIYFCGDVATAAPAPGGLFFDAPEPAATAFARDVFERKVFKERELARPGALALARGTRRLRLLQAAVAALAVIATLGLWSASIRLHTRQDELARFFERAALNVHDFHAHSIAPQRAFPEEVGDAGRVKQGTDDRAFEEAHAREIFNDLSNLNGDWFGSVFVPDSWFSGFNDEMRKAIATIYQEVIFTTLQHELERKPDAILDAALELSGAAPAGSVPGPPRLPVLELEELREFSQLRGYVANLQTLEINAKRYNDLRVTTSLQQLSDVVDYLFRWKLLPGFFERDRLYRQALAHARYEPIKPAEGRERTVAGAYALADKLFARLFDDNPAVVELERARAFLEKATAPDAGNDPEALAQSLKELRDHLVWAGDDLSQPALAWLAKEDLSLGPLTKVLVDMGRSEYLGSETADRIRQRGDGRFHQMRQQLLAMETSPTGRMVQADPKTGALALSERAKTLVSALDGLFGQGMMQGGAADAAARLKSPLPRVMWDTMALQQAAGLYKPYQESLDKILAPFSPSLRASLEISARNQLAARMMAKVAEAQRPAGRPEGSSPLAMEQALDVSVANFQTAEPSLTELSRVFASLGRGAEVTAAFAAQGEGILDDSDRLLKLLAPYTPKGNGFGWWDGKKGAALEAFDARDEGELTAYLATQRGALADLSARYVEPVIQALGRGLPASPVLRRQLKSWTGLADPLRRYAAKEPGNSVSALEELILKDLSEVEPATCTTRITEKMLTEPAADFFLERRQALRGEMRDRCIVLAGSQAAEGYARLATLFNQRLAGKFPFSDGLPGRLGDEADPGDLRSFFGLFDFYAPVVRAGQKDLPASNSAVTFMARMDDVRKLFAAFLDDPLRPAEPSFDVEVRFRENRPKPAGGNRLAPNPQESGGDRIVRWSVASGERVAIYPGMGSRAVLPWQLGEPLRLELQWAQDSPVVPVESTAQPGVRVEGRTAVIELTGRWSLLALLSRLKVKQAAADPATQLLGLTVITQSEDTPPAPAQVFLRLTLQPPQRADKTADKPAKDEPPAVANNLKIPIFPEVAPRWTAVSTSFSRPAGGRP